MSKRVDMTGLKYGRLTAIRPLETVKGEQLKWLFKCSCGGEVALSGPQVRKGNTRSCGCLATEVKRTKAVTHGLSKSPIRAVWKSMMQRCYKTSCKSYQNYGGRGITVCDRWHTFEHFFADMGLPNEGMTIERINNDAGYSPDNCRWASRKDQNNNTRQNVRIKYGEEEMTVSQWAEKAGIPAGTLRSRIKRCIPFPFALLNMNLHAEMYGGFA